MKLIVYLVRGISLLGNIYLYIVNYRDKFTKAMTTANDETFSAFGYDAGIKYVAMCQNDDKEKYYFFQRFKMSLYKNKKLSRETKIKDLNGKELLAIDVFSKLDGTVAMEQFPVGLRYIVADLGGGTADLAVHEVLEDHNLREIARSDGTAYGGILVDKAFQEFISDFF
ncbi:HS12B-like protein [Mya arenaria]|uniref:HS12B-like protein n=1 Tax=Mya arenaria TaxID=6604 RepID=A0ABY7EUB8_MYAAR|nr:HS12B-like protein [Mya arenaria]